MNSRPKRLSLSTMYKAPKRGLQFLLSTVAIITFLSWIYIVSVPTEIVVKKNGDSVSVSYGDKKLEGAISPPVSGSIDKDQNLLSFSVKKPREFAFLGYFLPNDTIRLNGQEIFYAKNPLSSSYLDNLVKWLDFKRDTDFSAYINFNDVGADADYISQKPIDDFEIKINTTGISIFSLKFGDSTTIFIRPNWHHEYEMSIGNEKYFGGPIGLDLLHLSKRICILWLFLVTVLSVAVMVVLALILILKSVVAIWGIFGSRLSKISIGVNLKYILSPKTLYPSLVILIALAHFLITFDIATNTLDSMPHTQDEVSYLFQAKLIQSGKIISEALPNPIKPFFYHEFIIDSTVRSGIYTLGAPIFFALGLILGLPQIVNPIFSAMTLALVMYIVKKSANVGEAIIVGVFYATSYFAVMQSSSFFSHTITQFFVVLVYLLYRFGKIKIFVGVALGMVFITRPYDGLLTALFLIINEVFYIGGKFFGKPNSKKFASVSFLTIRGQLALVMGFAPFLAFQLVQNYLVSGSIFILPINVYSPFSIIGFGQRGVEWPSEFTVLHALENTLFYFYASFDSFFALGAPLLFAPFAIFRKTHSKKETAYRSFVLDMLLIVVIFVIGYFPYYANGSFYGPRYWYGVAFAVFALVACGMTTVVKFLADFVGLKNWTIAVACIVVAILYTNIKIIEGLPNRFKNYNGVSKVYDYTFHKPTILLVDGKNVWQSYGMYFYKMSPDLSDPVIFAIDQGVSPKNQAISHTNNILKTYFPGREIKKIQD